MLLRPALALTLFGALSTAVPAIAGTANPPDGREIRTPRCRPDLGNQVVEHQRYGIRRWVIAQNHMDLTHATACTAHRGPYIGHAQTVFGYAKFTQGEILGKDEVLAVSCTPGNRLHGRCPVIGLGPHRIVVGKADAAVEIIIDPAKLLILTQTTPAAEGIAPRINGLAPCRPKALLSSESHALQLEAALGNIHPHADETDDPEQSSQTAQGQEVNWAAERKVKWHHGTENTYFLHGVPWGQHARWIKCAWGQKRENQRQG